MLDYLRTSSENFLMGLENYLNTFRGNEEKSFKKVIFSLDANYINNDKETNLIIKQLVELSKKADKLFRSLTLDLIWKNHLKNNDSNVMYYTAFTKFAILRNFYNKNFLEEARWLKSWITNLVNDALKIGVLKRNYDRIRLFGLSCNDAVLTGHGWNTDNIYQSYYIPPKLEDMSFPYFVKECLGRKKWADNLKRYAQKKKFIGFTDSEIRSKMEECCTCLVECYDQHKLLLYVVTAAFISMALFNIQHKDALEIYSDVLTRTIKSEEIQYLESKYYASTVAVNSKQ